MNNFDNLAYNSDFGVGIGVGVIVFMVLAILIFVIALLVVLSRSMTAAEENNQHINQILASIQDDRSARVSSIYLNAQKKLGIALLLSLTLGSIGAHKIYLGRKTAAILFFIFAVTGIPAIISVFNAFAMPKTISDYNLNLISSLYNQFVQPAGQPGVPQ